MGDPIEGGGEVLSVVPEGAGIAEAVRGAESRGLQREPPPALHLALRGQNRRVVVRRDGRQDGPSAARVCPRLWRSPAAAVAVNVDHCSVVAGGCFEVRPAAAGSGDDRGPESLGVVREPEVSCRLPAIDLPELLPEQARAAYPAFAGRGLVAESQFVTQECGRGGSGCAEVVLDLSWDEHLDREIDPAFVIPIPVPEQVPDVTSGWLGSGARTVRTPYLLRSLYQGVCCQIGQELDRVEHIGLADPVCARDAGERSELGVGVQQVLEPPDLEPRQHVAQPTARPGGISDVEQRENGASPLFRRRRARRRR